MIKKITLVLFFVMSCGLYAQTTTFYFIRHAEKVDNSKNPALSEKGLQRAKEWAYTFDKIPLKAIYSTDFIRTKSTAKPTAESKKLEITTYNPKTLELEQLVKDHAGQAILIVGHSNTTPELVNRFINENLYPPIEDNIFGNLYIVSVTDGKIAHQLLQGK